MGRGEAAGREPKGAGKGGRARLQVHEPRVPRQQRRVAVDGAALPPLAEDGREHAHPPHLAQQAAEAVAAVQEAAAVDEAVVVMEEEGRQSGGGGRGWAGGAHQQHELHPRRLEARRELGVVRLARAARHRHVRGGHAVRGGAREDGRVRLVREHERKLDAPERAARHRAQQRLHRRAARRAEDRDVDGRRVGGRVRGGAQREHVRDARRDERLLAWRQKGGRPRLLGGRQTRAPEATARF